MTKSPAPKPDEKRPGHFLANQSTAKAKLTQKILNSAWGMLATYLAYKANHAGKVFIKVSPHFSSQQCAHCSHIHPDNRQSQSVFVCQKCGYTANADYNAAEVIRNRGVEEILKYVTLGIGESARRGIRKTSKAKKPKMLALRSENGGRRRDSAELNPGSLGL